jgi:type IV pilus assembly protein PilO
MPEASFFKKVENIPMNRRILIFAGTLLVLGGLFMWLVYFPKIGKISRVEKEITGLEQRISHALSKVKNLARYEEEQAQLDVRFRKVLNLLPDQGETPNFLRIITYLERGSNIEFLLFQPKEERIRGFFIEIPVSIEFKGNYHDVALFFDKVARMDRIVNISDVSIRHVSEYSTKLITRCEAVTFRLRKNSDEKNEKTKKKE